MSRFDRRRVLKTLGAAAATPLAAPFLNLAHAQATPIPIGVAVPLTGNARIKQGKRFYQTLKDKTSWLAADDIAVVTKPERYPEVAEKGEKWIDISLRQQTLLLYEGKRAVYATLVSTGRDRLGDRRRHTPGQWSAGR